MIGFANAQDMSIAAQGFPMSENSFISHSITRQAAARLNAGTITASERIGSEAVFAIVDVSGNPAARERSERIGYFAVSIATNKAIRQLHSAFRSASWSISSRPQLLRSHTDPRFVPAASGFPIVENGKTSAVSASGGTWDRERAVAEKALGSFAK